MQNFCFAEISKAFAEKEVAWMAVYKLAYVLFSFNGAFPYVQASYAMCTKAPHTITDTVF